MGWAPCVLVLGRKSNGPVLEKLRSLGCLVRPLTSISDPLLVHGATQLVLLLDDRAEEDLRAMFPHAIGLRLGTSSRGYRSFSSCEELALRLRRGVQKIVPVKRILPSHYQGLKKRRLVPKIVCPLCRRMVGKAMYVRHRQSCERKSQRPVITGRHCSKHSLLFFTPISVSVESMVFEPGTHFVGLRSVVKKLLKRLKDGHVTGLWKLRLERT